MPAALRERSDTATAPPPHSETEASDVYGERYESLEERLSAALYWRASRLIPKEGYSALVEHSARLSHAYAELLAQQSEVVETPFEGIRRYRATYESSVRHILTGTAAQAHSDVLLRPARERLAQISRLEADWDSYGAEPPSTTAVSRAIALLESVEESLAGLLGEQIRPYAIAPVADGGVQLEWRGLTKTLEVEIGPDGDLGYLLLEGVEPNRTFTEADEVTSSEVLGLLARVLLS